MFEPTAEPGSLVAEINGSRAVAEQLDSAGNALFQVMARTHMRTLIEKVP